MKRVNEYRTHTCGEIRESDINKKVRVSGWFENVRDHGGVKFVDLRDQYGIVQVVVHDEKMLDKVSKESAVCASGIVVKRDEDTINEKLETGTVEILAETFEVLGKVREPLPFEVTLSKDIKEEVRLKYRYLDLRNKTVHENIIIRSKIISFIRNKMESMGFLDIQTPILTSSSPEGARDYIIPSRKHHGKFYALPQAPQIFKQLLMVSGFDKYFQIAPCFRDEDARADRSPGEFYQLDFEMAFATQEDVLSVAEEVLYETFTKFSDKYVSKPPFKRIPFKESMLKYGTDKPDLRNPLEIIDISDMFLETGFAPFKKKTVRAINVKNCASQSKSFFENMLEFATSIGMKGLGYVKVDENMKFLGPIDKFLKDTDRTELIEKAQLEPGCVLFFIADDKEFAPKLAGQIRTELAKRLKLIDENRFEMCFVVDFPMYEVDENTGATVFTHNPFSMPQGGLKALTNKDPLDIIAYQYDIVCNGIELSSGAVRNHDIDIMVKAFEIAGYTEQVLESKFSALYSAFKYGAPPHAGMAPGIDRIVMLITEQENIREVIAFPMNSNAQDLLTGAPCEVTEQQLRDVHIKIR
ncbi:aspartyl-tRNA synthetase [Sedimentibacter acidaminivorans]|jgi:aspartyl-tRNA synthetase|uniref:Aspartate--tRNA(Asp/Asn) ligase n=1 Tax=Sedimentibacter acidaminivorans TaxID=913099 RepID=A0ABS4GAD3_9FIRM|nr:aspartate--tRNA ligase [Sedimentibacter acidaminivorans]MBP1924656.1 aspartyl-tRNA synthetase [Sedimentibacter acidaminivorans]